MELDEVNFPMNKSLDGIRTLETGEDGFIYGIDRDNNFGRIGLTAGSSDGTFTYIATLVPEDDTIVGITLIPETIFQ